jgi:hypothetical protein
MKFLFFLLLAVPSSAREHRFTKVVEPFTLQNEIKAAGIQVDSISCFKTECTVFMPNSEAGDPSTVIAAHVYDPQAVLTRRAAVRARLRDLLVKFRADPTSITAAEQREAVFKTVALVLQDD